ncbi:MAG: GTPase ObgE [Spirochaetales bacterium]|nr:MAG: GTPase ObgE [Spirochaetales bacterium]
MSAFVDETRFTVHSGDGGAGSRSFRREKYVPRGGPDGGDGGRGGNVVFETRRNLSTLAHLRGKTAFRAQNGEPGRGRRMHGRDGSDMLIPVPPGTRILQSSTGRVLHDFSRNSEGEQWVCLEGGIGGLGNWHFRSARNQKPEYAQEGKPGASLEISLELALIGDIGLVGMPSAGKSSLINALTAAQSKVGAYPFTTKIPHLGVLRRGETEVVIVDIPGLIEGASEGAGLGHKFLRHVGRSASLAIMTDLGEDNPVEAVELLLEELKNFNEELLEKDFLIIGSKTDLDETGEKLKLLKQAYPGRPVLGISVFSRQGMDALTDIFLQRGSQRW